MDLEKVEKIYDISVLLGEENAVYPGDTPYYRRVDSAIAGGADYNLSTLIMSAHAGTHLDVSAHYIEGGMTIDNLPFNRFILPARVIEVSGSRSIKPAVLEREDLKEGCAVLFKTDNSHSGLSSSGEFSRTYVYLTDEAAEVCIDKEVSLVGIDYISIEGYEGESRVHRRLLENDILILEGTNLESVPPGGYTMICLPLKVKGGEASPVRAILLR
jgi:arylformamidase